MILYTTSEVQHIKTIKPLIALHTDSQQVSLKSLPSLPWQECHQNKTQSLNHQVNNSNSGQYQHAQYRWHTVLHCKYSKPINSMKWRKILERCLSQIPSTTVRNAKTLNFLLYYPAGSHFNILRKYLDSFVSGTGNNVYVIWWKHTCEHLLIMALETQQFSSTTTVPNLSKIGENRAISRKKM